ncbi:DEAD/DEAH box helicase family protein [Microaerobacter geothermalis]|uniref:DEAD/DEAH box helicase n=1 Tax=Microaerobacter geothermalis TaxID=674972 RepID=UPI001F1BE626|nr:helicase-related protein [Microaerobacter geothermalis]MCF6093402.1 DEAD/DEAH box helicase family protein [Microaerobacter geothermalis]
MYLPEWTLYVVREEGKWQTRITSNLEVDLTFWNRDLWVMEGTFSSLGRLRDIQLQLERTQSGHLHRNDWYRPPHREGISFYTASSNQQLSRLALIQENSQMVLPVIAGRILLVEEVRRRISVSSAVFMDERTFWDTLQWLYLQGTIDLRASIEMTKEQKLVCIRCGSTEKAIIPVACGICGTSCATCEACIMLGRSKRCTPLIIGHVREHGETAFASAREGSKAHSMMSLEKSSSPLLEDLSPPQRHAALQSLHFIKTDPYPQTNREFLIWAVCGAGKTEVIFPSVEETIKTGKKVLLATPRKDVVNELVPRFRKAFPLTRVVALHGESQEKWEDGHIYIATTHQTLRFYHHFPLVIVDEVDAYPFHHDPMLYYGVHRAKHPQGKVIYLSATPPRELQKKWKRGLIKGTTIPVRHHKHPLPVPKIFCGYHLQRYLEQHHGSLDCYRKIPILDQFLHQVVDQDRQAFLFASSLREVDQLYRYLTTLYPQWKEIIGLAHSRRKDRTETVEKIRRGEIRFLVTTTIMERGVTVPKVDVLVWKADSPIFDETSLVQIAGRVGRSSDFPDGTVIFLAREKTRAQIRAIRHIRKMNRLAEKMGYLLMGRKQ